MDDQDKVRVDERQDCAAPVLLMTVAMLVFIGVSVLIWPSFM